MLTCTHTHTHTHTHTSLVLFTSCHLGIFLSRYKHISALFSSAHTCQLCPSSLMFSSHTSQSYSFFFSSSPPIIGSLVIHITNLLSPTSLVNFTHFIISASSYLHTFSTIFSFFPLILTNSLFSPSSPPTSPPDHPHPHQFFSLSFFVISLISLFLPSCSPFSSSIFSLPFFFFFLFFSPPFRHSHQVFSFLTGRKACFRCCVRQERAHVGPDHKPAAAGRRGEFDVVCCVCVCVCVCVCMCVCMCVCA